MSQAEKSPGGKTPEHNWFCRSGCLSRQRKRKAEKKDMSSGGGEATANKARVYRELFVKSNQASVRTVTKSGIIFFFCSSPSDDKTRLCLPLRRVGNHDVSPYLSRLPKLSKLMPRQLSLWITRPCGLRALLPLSLGAKARASPTDSYRFSPRRRLYGIHSEAPDHPRVDPVESSGREVRFGLSALSCAFSSASRSNNKKLGDFAGC